MMESKLIEAVLRRAILQGGSVGYNPDMYDYGFADNIPPSEEFNNELKKYGTLRYSSDRYLFGCDTWSSFSIDERGRAFIKELDRKNHKNKYSRDDVKAMTQEEYESTICQELNNAGFRHEFRGKQFEYQPEESTFGGSIVFDADAVNHLKRIGLVDNGKCPMCSVREDDLAYKLQNSQSGAIYHVCKKCYKRYSRQEQTKRNLGCCLGGIIVIILVIWGIFKLLS